MCGSVLGFRFVQIITICTFGYKIEQSNDVFMPI